MTIVSIIKIITVLLLISVITSSSYNNIDIATGTATTLPQSIKEEEALPLSDQSFSSSTINLSNENSYDQQIASVGNKSYVVWADESTGDGDIYFKKSTDGGDSFDSTPMNLSYNPGFSERPQIVVSGNNVYVVWFDFSTGNNEILFKKSTDSGATFSNTTINLSNSTRRSDDPQIATSGNNLYVVWEDGRIIKADIHFKRSTDGGDSFSDATINLSNSTGNSYTPEIIASGNNIYVIWTDLTPGDGDIFFKKSTDGGATFSSPTINLSNSTGESAVQQAAVSGSNIYVVWSDSTTGGEDIYFTRSTDSGATFSNTTINLSNNTPEFSDFPQIATSGNNVYVIWADQNITTRNGDIFFKKSTDSGATFSSPTINLSNNTGRSMDQQITTSGTNVYVVWTDLMTGNGDIYFRRSTDSGATFSNTTINLSNNTGRSSNPEIIVSGSNIYVVWADSTTGNGDIYFRKSTDSGATFSSPTINVSNNTERSLDPQIAAVAVS